MEKIALPEYYIYVGTEWNDFQDFLAKRAYSKIAVIVDPNTHQHCLPILEKFLPSSFSLIEIPAGESFKNIDTCQNIWQQMMHAALDRNSLVLNLGGGVIGDMGGFCASTFKRGMDFIQIPTTLLSQVDASIGGKLGIDFMDIKNSIGLFKNPKAVFISPDFLHTLSFREIRSGFAEIIKHSLIADKSQWQQISLINDLSKVDWAALLTPSLLIKKRVVEEDPFEKGLRKALNFGHTIGHGIEGVLLPTKNPLLHGEAIAIGMICEAYLSHKILKLSERQLTEITTFILSIFGPTELDTEDFSAFIRLMKNDKKNENDQINFSLIHAIGDVQVNQTASTSLIEESLAFYKRQASIFAPQH